MRHKKLLLIIACAVLFAACSTKDLVDASKTQQTRSNTLKITAPALTPSSYLLANVDKSIQDSVIKRLHMDLNPDIEHLRSTAQIIRNNIPPVDFSSLKSVPVIARPLNRVTSTEPDSLLWIDKEFACFYGKTEGGEDIYLIARYTDWSKVKPDVNSPAYQARVKMEDIEKVNASYKRLQSRKGVDCWDIIVFKKGDIMFQTMEYARKQSDDGRFFVLSRGKHHSEICYFKDGKALSCRKSTKYDEIRVTDFATLIE